MSKITQYSRISHHTIAGSASAGLTFSVPAQEDFTDGSWTAFDLALSEIGVNEEDKRVYIRIGDTIEELGVIGGSALGTTPSLSQVLSVGNETLTNNIVITPGDLIVGSQAVVLLSDDSVNTVSVSADVSSLYFEALVLDSIVGQGRFNCNPQELYADLYDPVNLAYTHELQMTQNNGIILRQTDITNFDNAKINLNTNGVLQAAIGVVGGVITSELDLGTTSNRFYQEDGSTFKTEILMTNQSTLVNTEDLVTPKQGKLEIDRDFTYFGHFDGSTARLSFIQSQNDEIELQTQASGGILHSIIMDSSGAESISITTTAPAGDLIRIESFYDSGVAEPILTLQTQDSSSSFVSTGRLTNGQINLEVDVLGNTGEININVNDIILEVDEYIKQSSTNGTQKILRGTQQYVGEAQDNVQTTDATPVTGTVIFPTFTPVTLSGTTSCWFEAEVLGFGVTNSLAYGAKLFGVFKRTGGTVTQVSTTDKVEKTDFATATSDFTIVSNSILVEVTGEAGTDIDWNMSYRWKIQTQL